MTPETPLAGPVFWERRELDLLLRVYGRMVAQGEWRDYAMAGLKDVAEFAVFRRHGDAPAYRVEKRPSLRLKQGQYAVMGEGVMLLGGNSTAASKPMSRGSTRSKLCT